MLKFVYEKKKENDFFFEKKDENLISRSISLLKEIFNNSSNPNTYITLYYERQIKDRKMEGFG